MKYLIETFLLKNGNCPFDDLLSALDESVQVRIDARIARFHEGYFGDHKFVGNNILEARFFFWLRF